MTSLRHWLTVSKPLDCFISREGPRQTELGPEWRMQFQLEWTLNETARRRYSHTVHAEMVTLEFQISYISKSDSKRSQCQQPPYVVTRCTAYSPRTGDCAPTNQSNRYLPMIFFSSSLNASKTLMATFNHLSLNVEIEVATSSTHFRAI